MTFTIKRKGNEIQPPEKEHLLEMIAQHDSLMGVWEFYGVSRALVIKWMVAYDIPVPKRKCAVKPKYNLLLGYTKVCDLETREITFGTMVVFDGAEFRQVKHAGTYATAANEKTLSDKMSLAAEQIDVVDRQFVIKS